MTKFEDIEGRPSCQDFGCRVFQPQVCFRLHSSNTFIHQNRSVPKMWILPLLGYLGVLLGFCFLTLAIGVSGSREVTNFTNALPASGLYYLSELVEEHTVFTKKLLSRLIYAVIGIQILLLLADGFPITLSALSIGSHLVYYQNLRRFPIVKLTDPVFLVSCGMLLDELRMLILMHPLTRLL